MSLNKFYKALNKAFYKALNKALIKYLLKYKNFYYKYKAMEPQLSDDKITNVTEQNIPVPIGNILDDTQSEIQLLANQKPSDANSDTSLSAPILEETVGNPEIIEAKKDIDGNEMWLQLGDIIQITSPENEQLNDKIFYVDYVSPNKIIVIENESLEKITLGFENGVIENGAVKKISVLQREESPSYAIQNGLLPSTWIDVVFDDYTLTGEITNLEEDMIELRMHPDNETIYINFEYIGLPEEMEIREINVRDGPPEAVLPVPVHLEVETGEEIEEEEEEEEEEQNQESLEIVFGKELKPIDELLESDTRHFRYSIEEQTNDFLEVLLSNVPTAQRSDKILNNFNTIINRYKQLRTSFSLFDKNNNITQDPKTKRPYIYHDANWKPITKSLNEFNNKLLWILLVGKNIKNIFNVELSDEDIYSDIQVKRIETEMDLLSKAYENYKTNTVSLDENRYIELFRKINPDFTPFETADGDALNGVIYQKQIMTDMNVIINNYDDFKTSAATFGNDKKYQIKPHKFEMVRLNTGLEYIKQIKLTSSTRTDHYKMTPNDTLSLKSVMSLPEPTIRFSKVNLPGTNILDKANLAQQFLNYWKLLNSKTIVNNIVVDDFETPIEYSEENFMKDIKNYELNVLDKTNPKEDYDKFLNHIIPKTRMLFNLIKKYISGKLSFYNVVEYLEPFLIYPEDITYMQYIEINNYINGKNGMISNYVKTFSAKKANMKEIKNKIKPSKKEPTLQNLVEPSAYSDVGNIKLSMINDYFAAKDESIGLVDYKYTNSELLKLMIEKDFGNVYNIGVSLSSTSLAIPENISQIITQDKDELKTRMLANSQDGSCKTYIVAKKYSSVSLLEEDNGKELIFFDKVYDDTDYSILETVEKDFYKKMNEYRENVAAEDFLKFLLDKLKSTYKYDDADVPYVAESIMNASKKVLDGQYAIVNTLDEFAPEVSYYVRQNMEWVLDSNVPIKSTDQNTLCEIQPKCVSSKKKVDSKCESLDQIVYKSESTLLNNMVKQFENDYVSSMEALTQDLKNAYDIKLFSLKFKNIKSHDTKSINYVYNLGLSVQESELIVSPYSKYLDLIMGTTNFVEKQQLIILFHDKFTREANVENLDIVTGDFENINWFYCRETNIKLMPTFLYELANAFIITDNYNEVIEKIIIRCGKLSDDGDNWVDSNSGRVIKPIDLDVEEGFTDEGYKIVTREVMEKDRGSVLNNSKIINKYITNESKIINNIVNVLSSSMKIDVSNYHDFIISKTRELYVLVCPTEASYNSRVEEATKNGKKITETFEDLNNKIILYLTLGCFLITVQTSIPSVKTKFSFPGCVKSFTGYPVGVTGDLSALTYLACVAVKLKSPFNPWKLLPKTKTKAMEFIQEYINEYLMKDLDIIGKIKEKTDYILSNGHLEENILDEHNILSWTNFLPPLIPFKIKNLTDVDETFMPRLFSHFKSGSHDQTEEIDVIKSKIIKYSLAIQELIHKTVAKEDLLIMSSLNAPQLENACCNNTTDKTTLTYFINKTGDIVLYNSLVEKFTQRLNDIKILTNGKLFLSSEKTQIKIPRVPNAFNETTIYSAVIKYCNFKTNIPNSEEISSICGLKPNYLLFEDSLSEIIRKLKSDNRNYTNEQFVRLLQFVNKTNILKQPLLDDDITSPTYTPNELMNKFLAKLDFDDDEIDKRIIIGNLRELLTTYLDTFNIHDKYIGNDLPEIINLKQMLLKSNKSIRKLIVNFIQKYNNAPSLGSINVEAFLNNLSAFKHGDNFNEQNMLNYIKNSILSLGKVFPGMINNSAEYKIKAPAYWHITKTHKTELYKMSDKLFEPLKKYYKYTTLSKLLENVQLNTSSLILLSNKIPLAESSSFDIVTSTLLMEHCFLLVLLEYINLSSDVHMIVKLDIEYVADGEEEESGNAFKLSRKRMLNEKDNFKNAIAALLSDYLKIIANTKENISIPYSDIMDNVFKLKEAEKNRMRQRAEDLTEEELKVDNEFRQVKIGMWGKGENVRGYDGDRYDEEYKVMREFGEKEKRLAKNANLLDMDDLEELEETDQYIDVEENQLNEDEDWDDGDYYGEDQ